MDARDGEPVASLDRLAVRIERFLWFAIAAAVGGTWVFYEPITGKGIPGHAHPVFGTLLVAALTFGGIDFAKLARIKRELEQVAHDAGLPAADIPDLAARVAILQVEDPQLAQALRAMRPETRRTNPARRPRTAPQHTVDRDRTGGE